MLVCDGVGCDAKPVRVCKIAGVVRDYCLWHRRLFVLVDAVGWDAACAQLRRRDRDATLPLVLDAVRPAAQQPGPGLLHDPLPASGLAHAQAAS